MINCKYVKKTDRHFLYIQSDFFLHVNYFQDFFGLCIFYSIVEKIIILRQKASLFFHYKLIIYIYTLDFIMKIKAKETLIKVGKYKDTYRFIMRTDNYDRMNEQKVIEEAARHSGLSKSVLQTAIYAFSDVIKAWVTEGHSIVVPGLGSMRMGIKAKSVDDAAKVSSTLITNRRLIFIPSVDIKQALKDASVSISCYNRKGELIVNSKPGTTTESGGGTNFEG